MRVTSKTVLIIPALFLLLSGCASSPEPIPRWNGKVFVGDPEHNRFTHSKSGETLTFDRDNLDDYLALSMADLKSLYMHYAKSCEKWKPGLELVPVKKALPEGVK